MTFLTISFWFQTPWTLSMQQSKTSTIHVQIPDLLLHNVLAWSPATALKSSLKLNHKNKYLPFKFSLKNKSKWLKSEELLNEKILVNDNNNLVWNFLWNNFICVLHSCVYVLNKPKRWIHFLHMFIAFIVLSFKITTQNQYISQNSPSAHTQSYDKIKGSPVKESS